MFQFVRMIYRPAPHKPIATENIDKKYQRYRIQLFLTAYIGYMAYYFVRSTLALAKPHYLDDGTFDIGQLGLMGGALAAAYGLSKFLMGNVSDRCNPRYFLATGLILSAIINI